jgi:hypothetical protein
MRMSTGSWVVVAVGVALGLLSGCKGEGSTGSAPAASVTGTSTTSSVSATSASVPGSAQAAPSAGPAANVTKVAIAVDGKGFTPSSASFKKGEHAQLVFTRTSDETCAKEVVFPDINVKKALPLNQAVAIDVPTADARTLTFQCGMGMYKSKVTIQ